MSQPRPRPARRRRRGGAALCAALSFAGACGGGDPEPAPASEAVLSPACRQAFVDGHNLEAAGQPTNDAFLPSVEACASLEEWTAAAKDFGVDLRGQEGTFVDGVCAAAGGATRSRPICRQAEERFRAGS